MICNQHIPASRRDATNGAPTGRNRSLELLSVNDLRNRASVEWLLNEMVPLGGLCVLFGPSGSGKSFVALDWALSVSQGLDWLGTGMRRGFVVYIAAEGEHGLSTRIDAWAEARCQSALTNIRFLTHAISLHEQTQIESLLDALSSLPELPALIVIDTLSRCFVGGDENSAQDMGRLVDGVDAIRRTTGATVVLVHHSGKSDRTSERGSNVLRCAADTVIAASLRDGKVRLSCQKQKDGAPAFAPILLDLQQSANRQTCVLVGSTTRPKRDATADSSTTPRISESDRQIIQTLRSAGPLGMYSGELQQASGVSSSSFDRSISRLVERGCVAKGREGRRMRYRLAEESRVTPSAR